MDRFPLSWASSPLKGSQSFKNVPYMDSFSGDRWQCQLCSTGVMSRSTTRAHCNGFLHRREYSHLQAWVADLISLFDNKAKMAELEPRIEKIGFTKWRNHVEANMYRFMISKQTFGNVWLLLIMYEQWERLALLELVIWKHCCLADDRFECMQAIEDYWALDETFDPNHYKQRARLSSAAGTILSQVKSFL